MVCELKNLSEKNIRGPGGCEKKCPEAAEKEGSYVLNTVFNTGGKIFGILEMGNKKLPAGISCWQKYFW